MTYVTNFTEKLNKIKWLWARYKLDIVVIVIIVLIVLLGIGLWRLEKARPQKEPIRIESDFAIF